MSSITRSLRSEITRDEIAYLCSSVARSFAKPVLADDVVWTYAGVRRCMSDRASDAKAATRDYVLELDLGGRACWRPMAARSPPIAASPRKRSEAHALSEGHQEAKEGWTAQARPGGDFDVSSGDALTAEIERDYPFLAQAHATCYARTRATDFSAHAKSAADLGHDFGATLTEREVYLMDHEWAVSAEDIVWRRSESCDCQGRRSWRSTRLAANSVERCR